MKKNGFTLMELLGVIMILAILAVISFPLVLTQIKKSKQEIKNSTKILITDAAKDYYEDNINSFEQKEGKTYCIELSILINQGYLNGKLKDENLDNIDTTKKVKLVYHNSNFTYDVVKTCTNDALTRHNIEVPIVTENYGLYESTIEEGKYIYRGGNPINNWIELNEGTEQTPNYVKYRIISFEPDETIKVIRYESIGQHAWDTAGNRNENTDTYCSHSTEYGCNIWGNQSNMLYNGEKLETSFSNYYYADKTTTELTRYGNGTITKDATLNTYLNPINAQQESKWDAALNLDKYIQTHSFNVGGLMYSSNSDGDKGIIKEKTEESLFKWNGKIALATPTEFVEASTNTNCTSVWSNFNENSNNTTNPCSSNNWTLGMPTLFLTNRPNSSANVWVVNNEGIFRGSFTPKNATIDVRPVFYLKASTSLKGEGTESKPYRLVGE